MYIIHSLYLSTSLVLLVLFTSTKSTMAEKFKVLISNPTVPRIAYELLETFCNVTTVKHEKKEDILANINGVDGVFWATKVQLTKDILDAAGPQLKTVSTMSAGYNHIDTNELKIRNITLGHTPIVLNGAVADVAVMLALAASRRLHEGRLHIEKGTWISNYDTQWMLGQDITNSTIGIIGFGGIGQTIVKRLGGFEISKILYTGHREKPEGQKLGAKFVDLDTLVKESDFIFVSAPLTDETREMCNEDFFNKMKKTGVFINVSRGGLVDQRALINALKSGQIFAAGLDVMTPEPLPTDSELLKLPNVVLLPHLGSATFDTRNEMAKLAAQNLLRGLGGEEMFTPVDL